MTTMATRFFKATMARRLPLPPQLPGAARCFQRASFCSSSTRCNGGSDDASPHLPIQMLREEEQMIQETGGFLLL